MILAIRCRDAVMFTGHAVTDLNTRACEADGTTGKYALDWRIKDGVALVVATYRGQERAIPISSIIDLEVAPGFWATAGVPVTTLDAKPAHKPRR